MVINTRKRSDGGKGFGNCSSIMLMFREREREREPNTFLCQRVRRVCNSLTSKRQKSHRVHRNPSSQLAFRFAPIARPFHLVSVLWISRFQYSSLICFVLWGKCFSFPFLGFWTVLQKPNSFFPISNSGFELLLVLLPFS